MSKQGEFMIFSAEQYKYAKKLTGRQLDELFSKYRVWDYLYACYEALHTTAQTISFTISISISMHENPRWLKLMRIYILTANLQFLK